MSAVVLAFQAYKPNPQSPWQNEELAELYRAVDILTKAGLPIETDMGMSDEGDPWFAFCRSDTGEVIVHCARINGLFVATSVAIDQTFRGSNFREVINSIVRYEPLKMPLTTSGPRLFVHPVMVLAAFVATALLFAKKADAQDLHAAVVSLTAHDGQPGHKSLAAVKAAVGDFLQSLALGGEAKPSANPLGGSESVASLSTLMAAAMSLVATVVEASGLEYVLPAAAAVVAPVEVHGASLTAADPAALALLLVLDHAAPVPQADADTAYQTWVHTLLGGSGNVLDLKSIGAATIASASTSGAPAENSAPPLPADTSHPVAAQPILFDHTIVYTPAAHATVAAAATGATTASSSQTTDSTHSFDLSELSPVAAAILVGSADAQPQGGDPLLLLKAHAKPSSEEPSSSTPSGGSAGAPDTNSPAPASGSTVADSHHAAGDTPHVSPPAAPTPAAPTPPAVTPLDPTPAALTPVHPQDAPAPVSINLTAADPTAALAQLHDYAESNHSIGTSPINPLPELSVAVNFYNSELTHPTRLLVFDSTDIKLPYFEFTKGVLLVDDHELGIAPSADALAHATTVYLASGGTMKLLGVIDTAHMSF